MLAMPGALVFCALIIAMQPPQTPAASQQQEAEQATRSRTDPSSELAVQMQRLLDYLEHKGPHHEQPPRVGEIGAQSSKRSDRILARLYDIGDLFIPAPAYPARYAGDWDESTRVFPELTAAAATPPFGTKLASSSTTSTTDRSNVLAQQGGMGGGMGGMVGRGGVAGTPEARPDLDALVQAITSTIAPNSWSDVGGESTISTLGTVLLVSAPEEIQRQVDQFLRLLRQLWGTSRTVRVHAFWLWLSDAELAALFPEGGTLTGAVNRQAWDTMQKQLAQAADRPTGYRAHLACFDGQTVFVAAGDRRLTLSGLKPVLAAQAVAYEPEVKVLHQGAVLQVTPTATSEAKSVILDVHSRVTEVRDAAAGGKPRQTDRVPEPNVASEVARFAASLPGTQIEEHHLASTLLVPVRTVMLVGGMSGKPNHASDQLYLFVEVAVEEPPQPVARVGGE
jgi:hypothetical protein